MEYSTVSPAARFQGGELRFLNPVAFSNFEVEQHIRQLARATPMIGLCFDSDIVPILPLIFGKVKGAKCGLIIWPLRCRSFEKRNASIESEIHGSANDRPISSTNLIIVRSVRGAIVQIGLKV